MSPGLEKELVVEAKTGFQPPFALCLAFPLSDDASKKAALGVRNWRACWSRQRCDES